MTDDGSANEKDKSGYVFSLSQRIEEEKNMSNDLTSILEYCSGLDNKTLPPLSLVNNVGSFDYEHFKSEMRSDFEEIFKKFKINSNTSLLEIGCGCGKAAIPLSRIIEKGIYVGVDVNLESITWLKNNFVENDNFRFELINPSNNYYSEDFEEHKINNFKLDLQDKTIDLAFGFSVFTHLIKRDIEIYLSEIYMVFKQDGLIFFTSFIIDEFFYSYREKEQKFLSVKRNEQNYFQAYKGQDFFCGFELDVYFEMFRNAGFNLVSFELGTWADKPGATKYQDRFLFIKN